MYSANTKLSLCLIFVHTLENHLQTQNSVDPTPRGAGVLVSAYLRKTKTGETRGTRDEYRRTRQTPQQREKARARQRERDEKREAEGASERAEKFANLARKQRKASALPASFLVQHEGGDLQDIRPANSGCQTRR